MEFTEGCGFLPWRQDGLLPTNVKLTNKSRAQLPFSFLTGLRSHPFGNSGMFGVVTSIKIEVLIQPFGGNPDWLRAAGSMVELKH